MLYDLLDHRQYNCNIPSSATRDPLHTWKLTKLTISTPGKRYQDLMSVVSRAVPSLGGA